MKFIAKTLEGLEEILADELSELGVQDIEIWKRAVAYSGDKMTLYKSNLLLRTCLKVLVFMKEFTVENETDLYNEIKKIPWEEYLGLDDTFAIDSVVNSDMFRHANFIALKAKDAVADRFREKYNQRPNVDTQEPTLKINTHIRANIVTVSLDSSGQSLHMRGYRKHSVDAPLNEVLAAGLVLMSGWDKTTTLMDPMCGSATILCEAAKIAGKIPPQSPDRAFAFKKWKSYDPELYHMVCEETERNINTDNIPPLLGYDINQKAVQVAITNIGEAGLSDFIKVEKEDFFYLEGSQNLMLIFNPPYDARLKEKDVLDFYSFIGDKLKLSFQGCSAWILSGHMAAMKNVGLRPSAKKSLLNGSIPSLFCRYDMYAGSKKQKWQNMYPNETEIKNENADS